MNLLLSTRLLRTLTIRAVFTTAALSPLTQAEDGTATYYSDSYHGRSTANGEMFDQQGLTAAHNGLPFGTRVKVTNLANSQSVEVTINDRMGRHNQDIIDLTRRAARELDFERQGRARVRLAVLQ